MWGKAHTLHDFKLHHLPMGISPFQKHPNTITHWKLQTR